MADYLTLDDIKPLVNIPKLIGDIEEGFGLYSRGQVVVPPIGFLHFEDPPGDVHIKYGYVKGDDFYALKMASGFYDNPKLGLPASDGLILVFSQKTGELKVILKDECWLTDIRTAVAGAVAAKHMAPKLVRQIGIIGTGAQARLQLEMLTYVTDCECALIWGRNTDKADEMIAELEKNPALFNKNLKISRANHIEEITDNCQLIVTTTPAKKPLITAELVRKGTHITAMGSDDNGKQELEASLLGKADIVVADSISQCVDHGECGFGVNGGFIAKERILELGQVIEDPSLARRNDDQITIVDLTGVAIQDIQIAKMVYRAYLEKVT